jgi:DNA-directed RNA polymerase subunit RPC12/RpoP
MKDQEQSKEAPTVECPRCGAKSSFEEDQCRRCSADLAVAKELAVAIASEQQLVRAVDGSMRPMIMDDLMNWADEAKSMGICVVCARRFGRFGMASTFACSFCGGLICDSCMEHRRFEIRDPLLSHMIRFGLTQFPGVVGQIRYGAYQELQPGYYLCKNCLFFLNGPEFVKHAKTFYENTGRLEELAELQEHLGRFEDAKRIRQTARARTPPNLNGLIDKLREVGLAVPYRCPSCGANITIDSRTSADGLKFCSYCGTAVNMDALVRVIEASLKY